MLENKRDKNPPKKHGNISVWENASHLSVETWAKQHTNSHFVTGAGKIKIGTFDGYMIRSTNLVAPIIYMYVANGDRIYQLHYTDIVDEQETSTSSEFKSCWKKLLNQMIQSFSPTSQAH